MTILIVEDDPVSQDILTAMLRRLGYAVQVVGDGRAAIDACLAQAPELVFMDVQMPGMDGLAATRELRRLQGEGRLAAFPIVVYSGSCAPADRAACFDAGANGFVTKPPMLAKVGAELHRVLVLGESGRQLWEPEPAFAVSQY